MTTAHMDGQGDAYRALLAVSEALVSHRDSSARSSSRRGRPCKFPLGMWRSEVRSQKSEVRGQKSEINDGALTSDLRPLNSGRTLADAEREHIVNVVRETGCVLGGPKGAAARLGMKRSTLRWKMKRLGISRPI